MAFRIQLSTSAEAIVFALSGEIDDKNIERLKKLLDGHKQRRILLDLEYTTLVRREAVEFLARLEEAGVGIINCPDYVRTWIDAGKRGEHRGSRTRSLEDESVREI